MIPADRRSRQTRALGKPRTIEHPGKMKNSADILSALFVTFLPGKGPVRADSGRRQE